MRYGARRVLAQGAIGLLLLTEAIALGASESSPDVVEDYLFVESQEGFVPDDPYALWEYGYPSALSGLDSASAVWSTGLNTRYIKDARSALVSPGLVVGDIRDLTLLLTHAYVTDVSTGDCAAALAEDPFNDDVCADGGLLRLRRPGGTITFLEPDGGYNSVAALDGQPVGVFAGDSDGLRQDWFDLIGKVQDNDQIELLFSSNSQQTSLGLGWYLSELTLYEGDHIPPQISIPEPLGDTWEVKGPYPLTIQGRDNRASMSVNVSWYTSREPELVTTAPAEFKEESNAWVYELKGQESDTIVYYRVEGVDSNQNRTVYPPPNAAPLSFTVQLPPPTNVAATCPETEATSLKLTWTPPRFEASQASGNGLQVGMVSTYSVDHYEILHLWTGPDGQTISEPLNTTAAAADAPVSEVLARGYPGLDAYQVRAIFDVRDGPEQELQAGGWSKASQPCQVVVPQIIGITPGEAWQGTSVELTLLGAYTRFVQDDLNVSLGEGISVLSTEVIDVNQAIVSLEIAEDALLGDHDLEISWPGIELTVPSGLNILPFDQRPRIVAVSPPRITQSDKETIKFTGLNTDFKEGRLAVQFGPGITVGSLNVQSSTEFEVPIEAANWAPFGPRTITVVSGELSFNVDFRVDVQAVDSDAGCAMVSSSRKSGPMALLISITGVFFLLRRRRTASEGILRGDHVAQPKETQQRDQHFDGSGREALRSKILDNCGSDCGGHRSTSHAGGDGFGG